MIEHYKNRCRSLRTPELIELLLDLHRESVDRFSLDLCDRIQAVKELILERCGDVGEEK